MSRIYLSSTLMWNSSLEEIFDWTCRSGLDGIELWAQHFFARGYSREKFRCLAALYSMSGCLHSQSWDLNLASLNSGIRAQSVEEVKRSIDLAVSLDLSEVTVHPGHKTMSADIADYEANLRQSLQELVEYAESRHICLSLEIMEKIPKEFVTDMEAMQRVCGDLFSRCVYTLDIAHCDSEQEAIGILDAHRDRISKIHISNRVGTKFHTPLDTGDYDMEKLLPKLMQYDLPFVIEGLDLAKDFPIAKRNVAFVQTVI